jgi:transcriptional regulator with XRE-family HTH domain
MPTEAMPDPDASGFHLGDWLTQLRSRAGLSQAKAAEAVATEERNIRRWEKGGAAPGGLMLLRLLSAYGVRLDPLPPSGVPRAINDELMRIVVYIDDLASYLREHLADQHKETMKMTRRIDNKLDRTLRAIKGAEEARQAQFAAFQELRRERDEARADPKPVSSERKRATG